MNSYVVMINDYPDTHILPYRAYKLKNGSLRTKRLRIEADMLNPQRFLIVHVE